jgi:ATP-dependent HslUV protease ATP-binding subunit HslU
MQEKLLPTEIVKELDKWIIGQAGAKKAVAIALRNRWRRSQVDEPMRDEIVPKNILMIGPTGVGKTEIARRLAVLAKAPFIKVEATKFTEVGYVGRDVDSIIRDLADEAVFMYRSQAMDEVEDKARKLALKRVVDSLKKVEGYQDFSDEKLEKMVGAGEVDDVEVEMKLASVSLGVEIISPPGMEEMTGQLQNLMQNIGSDKKKIKKISVEDALKSATEEESSKLVNEDDIIADAIEAVEQQGIVFIDEIDKVVKSEHVGGDVSREGVQRDLLPLIEGCTISTKYGLVKTDHILFIASGAFMGVSPADMASELQGRLPIRVELKALMAVDLAKILTEPMCSLTAQYKALLAVEGVSLKFMKGGVQRLADIAFSINESSANIGARRLHTIMEKLLEDVSFNSDKYVGTEIKVDAKFVDSQLSTLVASEDLSKWIL